MVNTDDDSTLRRYTIRQHFAMRLGAIGLTLISAAAKIEPALEPVDQVVKGALKGVRETMQDLLDRAEAGEFSTGEEGVKWTKLNERR